MTTPRLAQHVKGKGRHYQHPTTGELVPSVTNVLSVMGKGDVLMRWAAKLVAERAAVMKHALPNMDDGDIVDTLKAVPFARSKRASDRGTDIHDYLEKRLHNEEVPALSDDAEPYREAADSWLENEGIEVWDTEVTVFHAAYAGTVDFIGKRDDRWVIGDFKTSKAIYPEAALQLAGLWGCTLTADGEPVPWAGQATDLEVIRIGQDGYEVKVVEDPFRQFETFISLLGPWHWKHSEPYVEVTA